MVIIEQVINGLSLGATYALVAAGLAMIFGVLEIVNFAHGEFFMIGSYLFFVLYVTTQLPYPIAGVLTVLLMAVFGALFELLVIRPVIHRTWQTQLVATLGASVLFVNAAIVIFGTFPQRAPTPFVADTWTLGSIRISEQRILLFLMTIAAFLVLHWFVRNTKLGKAMRAVSQNRDACAAMRHRRAKGGHHDLRDWRGSGRIGVGARGSAGEYHADHGLLADRQGVCRGHHGRVRPCEWRRDLRIYPGYRRSTLYPVHLLRVRRCHRLPGHAGRLAAAAFRAVWQNRRHLMQPLRFPVWMIIVLVTLLILPLMLQTPYFVGVAITTLMYVALALGFDLIVGRTGLLSLAVAGFFGIGAYAAALVGLHWHGNLPLRLLMGIVAASVAAVLVGIPSFRLSYHSFAMGTLAFALIAQVVALNWIEVTRGPLCLSAIPPANLQLGSWSWAAQGLRDYYYLMLAIAVVTFLIVRQIERTRIGRTLSAIRDDEQLAAGVGTPVLRYKLLAFTLGAGIAGAVGAFYASYASVVCPSELAFVYTVNLIVILFLGGRGTLVGPILAAVLFTAVPELLRATQSWRLVIYGLLIIVGAIYMPEGIVTTTIAWVQKQLQSARRASHG